jgi:hypothetical protein
VIASVTIADSREREIADAVASVAPHVDRVLLVDTGATDRTVDLAREVAGKKLAVTTHDWVDFSTARNAALDFARGLSADWVIVVDSDERLHLGAVDLRAELSLARVDVLLVDADDGSYPKEKVIRAAADVRYVGPTHECLVGGTRETLRGVTFSELPKTEEQVRRKCARDVEILTECVSGCEAEDPRWWFYLGLALEGVGDRPGAAKAFGRCAKLRKTGHEAAWAGYKQAEQLHLLGEHAKAIRAAARGLGADPTYAECAWVAAESAAKLGAREQVVAWARIAEAVGRHRGCGVDRPHFRHLPALYELPYDVLRAALPEAPARARADLEYQAALQARLRAVAGIGERDADWVSVSRSTSAAAREAARSMLRPPPIGSSCPSARATRIRFDPPGGRVPMNPSVCWHDGQLWCVVRAVNYSLGKDRQYAVHDPRGVVRSDNYLGVLEPDGRLSDPALMEDFDPADRYPSGIVGYEDVRLVSVDGDLTASATVCDRDPGGRRLVARLHIDDDGDVARADVQPSNQLHEKNWMPLSVGGQLTWIYSLDPTAVLPGPLRDCPLALDHLRGGAAIAHEGGYLCVTHEVIYAADGRVYLHRFVRLDADWRVTGVTPAWVFAHHGVEFCAGMARDSDQILLTYGVEDREAWVLRVDVRDVGEMRWISP